MLAGQTASAEEDGNGIELELELDAKEGVTISEVIADEFVERTFVLTARRLDVEAGGELMMMDSELAVERIVSTVAEGPYWEMLEPETLAVVAMPGVFVIDELCVVKPLTVFVREEIALVDCRVKDTPERLVCGDMPVVGVIGWLTAGLDETEASEDATEVGMVVSEAVGGDRLADIPCGLDEICAVGIVGRDVLLADTLENV